MMRHGPLGGGDDDWRSEGTSCHQKYVADGGEGEPPPMMTMLRCGSARAALLGKRICANQGEGLGEPKAGVMSWNVEERRRNRKRAVRSRRVAKSGNDG